MKGGPHVAVSKRLRYEVLRRDNYTCRYCGAFAPVAALEVDHVTPRKHGGRDAPENLITACQDCNRGKSAALPEDWLAAEIEQIARRWRDDPDASPDEDDLSDMHAYQDALYFLETLAADRVLHYIAKAHVAAMPYRPTHSELIQCAGMIARRETEVMS
jgi:hypothetical protein